MHKLWKETLKYDYIYMAEQTLLYDKYVELKNFHSMTIALRNWNTIVFMTDYLVKRSISLKS